jgi:hypothetical protein
MLQIEALPAPSVCIKQRSSAVAEGRKGGLLDLASGFECLEKTIQMILPNNRQGWLEEQAK